MMNSGSYKNKIKPFSRFNQYPLYSLASTCFEAVLKRLWSTDSGGASREMATWFAVRTCYLRLTDRQSIRSPLPFVYLTRLFRSLSLSPFTPPSTALLPECAVRNAMLSSPSIQLPSFFPSAKRFPMVNHNARARTRISHSHEGAAGTYVAYAAFGLILSHSAWKEKVLVSCSQDILHLFSYFGTIFHKMTPILK